MKSSAYEAEALFNQMMEENKPTVSECPFSI